MTFLPLRFPRPLIAAAVALLAVAQPAAGQDTDPPVISVLESGVEMPDGAVFPRAAVLVIEVTDASSVTVTAVLDSVAFTSGTTVAGEGLHQLSVEATDAAGNTAALDRAFTIDTVPPVFLAVAPPDGSLTAAAEVTLSGEVAGADAVEVDGQPATLVGGEFSAGPFALAEGARSWSLAALDAAGHRTERTHGLVRDSTPPAITVGQPAAGALVRQPTVDVTGTAADPHLLRVEVNGTAATLAGGTFLAPAVSLAEGPNTLLVEAVDGAGNAAQATRQVTLDTQPPEVAITDPAAGTVTPRATLVVAGTVADPHADRVEVAGVAATLAGSTWTAEIPLVEGPQELVAKAWDRLDWSAEARVTVVRDSTAPEVRIVAPSDGARLSAESVDVGGTVEEEADLVLTLNGEPVTADAGAWSRAAVPLVEGENRLIARVTDRLGNQGAHTRIVYRDTIAPVLVAADPVAGALAIPPATSFRLTFSERLAVPAAGAWRLETAAGTALAATASSDGAALTIVPETPLASRAVLRLVLTTALTDLAGNPLAQETVLDYIVADVEAPAPPTLTAAPPLALCAARVTLGGFAEPEAVVEVLGGAGAAAARAAADGSFAVTVDLRPGVVNRLELVARDVDGNRSPPLAVELQHDCAGPRVVSAEMVGETFLVHFDEPVEAASASAADGVTVEAAGGPVAGAVSLDVGGLTATFTPGAPLPAAPWRLEAGTGIRDLAGNALAFAFSRLFGGGVETAFLTGQALDAATGRPLAGARVMAISTDGVANAEPRPEQTTAADGRFRIPIGQGTHLVEVTRSGSTPVYRIVVASSGGGADVFDPRPTRAAPSTEVGAEGGNVGGHTRPRLDVPPLALPATTAVALTALDEQALPALLPYGWSPRGAAWVDLGGAALAEPATLTLPVEAENGVTLALARLDGATLQWLVVAVEQVIGGTVTVPVDTEGAYAAVEADLGQLAPAAAVVGAPLPSSPAPSGGELVSAAIAFEPAVVLPSQTSRVTLSFVLSEEAPSGLAVVVEILEELTLLDGSLRRQPPYRSDLVVYRDGSGAPRARFGLRPSHEAQRLPLQMGAEDVVVHPYAGGTVQGDVLGPLGGSVGNAEGDRVEVPAAALAEPAPVSLARRPAADLPLDLPPGLAVIGLLHLDLSGAELAVPATLRYELGAAPAAGEKGLLFVVWDLDGELFLRPVAELAATATGWASAAIDAADLPWPGVRWSGLYLFARTTVDLGFARGGVFGVSGAVLPGAQVDSAAVGWAQIANESGAAAGRYVLPLTVASHVVTARVPASGDLATGSTAVAAAEERVDLDLFVQVTAPRVVETVPGAGATGVPAGIEPTVRFSEPIDGTTAAQGVLLLHGGQVVAASLTVQGDLVRLLPRATLLPGGEYELRVTTAIRDLSGHRLAQASSVTFTVQLPALSGAGVDPTRIHLFEPDGAAMARVLGRAGAVPAGSLVFVENLSRLVSTPSVTADGTGGFETAIEAALDDRLLLHVVIDGANEVVLELAPFLTADGKAAHVGREAVRFTTTDGLTIEVEEGTFAQPTTVRALPRTAADVRAPVPADFQVLATFELDFAGAVARKALHLELPVPAGLTGSEALLARGYRLFGEEAWMLHDLLRVEGGVLTTAPPPDPATAAGSWPGGPEPVEVRAALEDATSGPRRTVALASTSDRKTYVPGAANPGLYMVMQSSSALDFLALPFLAGQQAYFQHLGIEGLVAVVNSHVESLLAYDAVLIPTRRGQTIDLVGRDLATGYRFFEQTFAAPAAGELLVLPPDLYGDVEAPVPVAGSPLRFFFLDALAPTRQEIEPRIVLDVSEAAGGLSLTVTGDPGAVDDGAAVRLVGLDGAGGAAATASADGAFVLSAGATAGQRYVLAVGARVGATDALEIAFSEGLPTSFAGIEVRDAAGRLQSPRLDPVGSSQVVRLTPQPGWRAGETYTLRLLPSLADAAGNAWGALLELPFTVEGSRQLDTYPLAAVRDVARLGSLLFVAAGADGLVVLDASNPSDLVNPVAGDLAFPFAYGDPVEAVATDAHGRVLVAGGGLQTFGQLKVFDPLAFDPAAIAAAPGDPAVRYAAFRGSTLLSDWSGGTSSLPAGRPRRVTVLTDDDTAAWRLAADAAPAGLTLDPASPPASGEYLLTVSGADGTAGHPVTLRNLTRGRWRRVDADAGGAYSLTLRAAAGDRLELRRNRRTIAYVATLGVGVQVVDVDAFYGEAPEDWEAPDPQSDVVGTYTGFGDPSLRLCSEPVSDISTALLDLGTLFGDPAHPLTLVGLVAFRGLGFFESDPADVGDVSFFNEVCARIDGNAQVAGLEVVEDYPFDFDGDGAFGADEIGDYVLVAHRTAGLLIFDATDRDNVVLAGRVVLPGQAERVSVDRDRRRAYVSAAAAGIFVVDFGAPPSALPLDADGDALDDRLLEIVPLTGNTNSPVFLLPELGLAFAGGTDRGVTSLAVGEPRLTLVAEAGVGEAAGPRFRAIDRVAPLGVPSAAAAGGAELPASFRVLAALPGTVGPQVRLDVVSLGAGGLPIDAAGDPAAFPALPVPALAGGSGLILDRLADQAWEEGFQLYLSEEVAAVADLRAARAYARTPAEAAECARCVPAAAGVGDAAREVLSGQQISVRVPESLVAALGGGTTAAAIASTPWEIAPALRQEPPLNPSLGTGDVVPGTLLHSGEMTLAAVDLAVRGRGFDFAFERAYRSQTLGAGPLGPGWDHRYRQRLRELPNGDVELYDGSGRRDRFARLADGGYQAPAGLFVELARGGDGGWVLVTRHRGMLRFDRFGRLLSIADATKESAASGNEMRFHYDLRSRLAEIVDTLDRRQRLAYDAAGRLVEVVDFDGRRVAYGYDAAGRLATVTSPAVTVGQATFANGLTTTYAYQAPGGDLAASLHLAGNLASVTDPRQVTWLTLGWGDEDGDGRADEVVSQTWGAGTATIDYDFTGRVTWITDRRAHISTYRVDEAGRTLEHQDAALFVTRFQYDAEGNLVRQESPLGTVATATYDAVGGARSRGNLVERRVQPGPQGANGSAEVLATEVQLDSRTNLPTRITDPRGAVTEIERDAAGLPQVIRQAAGTPETGETVLEHNAFGQPVRLVDANGDETRLEYFESGPAKGYLRRRVVDPGDLALTTSYEVDARGNVTAVVDPRGVRHEWVYNELDWLVEERAATTGSADGAAPLGYRTVYVRDAAGQVVETRLPSEDADGVTIARATYGPLGEVTRAERERVDGDFVGESYRYDANLNLIEATGPEGEVTTVVYDPRDLPVRVERSGPTLAVPQGTSFTYDGEGRVVASEDPRGKLHHTAFDGYGRPAIATDPFGNRTLVRYDDGGNPIEVEERSAADCLLSQGRHGYDLRGRTVERTAYLWEYPAAGQPCGTLPATARGLTTRLAYDPVGNLLRHTDPLGRVTETVYDAAGRPQRMVDAAGNAFDVVLDAAGNAVEEQAAELAPDGSTVVVRTHRRYDALGRQIATADALGNETRWVYDPRGNLRLTVDAEGHATEQVWDGLDRLTSVTRPEGIRVEHEYDASGRPTVYRDALGNETRWSYDALGRPTSVTYPDLTTESSEYDAAGNLVRRVDARGVVVDQAFDDLNRLISRQATLVPGIEGPTTEAFAYDGLGRLEAASRGAVATTLAYDSLSRLVSDTTAGRTVTYAHDDGGSEIGIGYPSGLTVGRRVDALGRASAVGELPQMPEDGVLPTGLQRVAGFGYRGPGLLAEKSFGPETSPLLRGTMSHDPARRLVASTFLAAGGDALYAESLGWTPRGFKARQERSGWNGVALDFAYDDAGRLTEATRPEGRTLSVAVPDRFAFTYDAAENLLARVEEGPLGTTSTTALPLDGSGRNRPGAVAGTALAWDAAGNLVDKGGLGLHYDFGNRLVRVSNAAGTVGAYEYDAFNRRVRRTVGGRIIETVWSGWQSLEDYVDGTLSERHVYGLELDEVVRTERDTTGDGIPDQSHHLLYDSIGNVALAMTGGGLPIERYEYSPYGERWVVVNDLTPPVIEQIRVVGDALWLEVSEEVSLARLEAAVAAGELALADTATTAPIAVTVAQPVQQGPMARHRAVVTPTAAPGAGVEVRFTVGAGVLVDDFGNRGEAVEEVFTWTPGVVSDTAAPKVMAIAVEGGRVRVTFSEEVEAASAAAHIQVDGGSETWTVDGNRYTLVGGSLLSAGGHTVVIGSDVRDLADSAIGSTLERAFGLTDSGSFRLVYEAPDPDLLSVSTIANRYGLHGRPVDEESGLAYFRNRYLDAGSGRFVTVDPLLFVDGPNAYSYAAGQPTVARDPLGLECRGFGDSQTRCVDYLPELYGKYREQRIELTARIRNPALNVAERNEARREANRQMFPWLFEEAGRLVYNLALHWPALEHDEAEVVRKRAEELTAQGVDWLELDSRLRDEGYDTSYLVKGAMPGPPWARGLGKIRVPRGPEQLRRVGDLLESVDDTLANPQLLRNLNPADLQLRLGERIPPGWRIEALGRGAHKGEGFVLRQYTPQGDPTGRQIRWHPGGGHHGPDPYWRVIDANTKSDIIPGAPWPR